MKLKTSTYHLWTCSAVNRTLAASLVISLNPHWVSLIPCTHRNHTTKWKPYINTVLKYDRCWEKTENTKMKRKLPKSWNLNTILVNQYGDSLVKVLKTNPMLWCWRHTCNDSFVTELTGQLPLLVFCLVNLDIGGAALSAVWWLFQFDWNTSHFMWSQNHPSFSDGNTNADYRVKLCVMFFYCARWDASTVTNWQHAKSVL